MEMQTRDISSIASLHSEELLRLNRDKKYRLQDLLAQVSIYLAHDTKEMVRIDGHTRKASEKS